MIDLKLPPHSKEAEQSIIGGLFLDNSKLSDVELIIKESDFYKREHQIIFKAMTALASKQKPFDVVTVTELLESRKVIDDVGGMPYLAELANNTPSAANIVSYANIVKERATMRELIKAGSLIQDRAYNHQDNDSNSILESAYDVLRGISISGDTDVVSLQETVTSAYEQLEKRYQNDGEITGLSTGFDAVDKKTNGLQKGELYIIAARPAQGKSTLAINISLNAALLGKHVLFFSLEMPKERIIDKAWSSVAGVDFEEIKTGNIETESWPLIANANDRLLDSGLIIDDRGDQALGQMMVKAKRIDAKKKLDLIVVDYLQLVRVKGMSRLDEVSEVSRQLKAIAKNLSVPVIALAQLNRGVESRADKRPRLADLRESGQIEQDADAIFFLYRDEYYYPENPQTASICEYITAKNRFGETGMDLLRTDFRKSRFLNITGLVNYVPHEEKQSKGGFNG